MQSNLDYLLTKPITDLVVQRWETLNGTPWSWEVDLRDPEPGPFGKEYRPAEFEWVGEGWPSIEAALEAAKLWPTKDVSARYDLRP